MSKHLVAAAALLVAFALRPAVVPAAADDHPWGANYFPNVPLVTQDGKTVRFYDDLIKDKRVLVNFIFTRCTDICPLATAKLAQVQKLLGPRIGRDVFIYSITLDPEHDSAKELKAYAAKYGVGPGWLFLTGTRADIDAVRFKLGERRDKTEHPNIVRLGNGTTDQWMRLPLSGDVTQLVSEIGKTLIPNWYAGKAVKSFEEAPRVEYPESAQVLIREQALFRDRCAVCHTIGKGYYLGPDLRTVAARRQRAWLMRYLAEPEKMRARKDPIALELAKRNKVLMPNLQLTRVEIEDLVDFLETRTAR
jgi:protein SCO1